MSTEVKRRRGTSAEHEVFTGGNAEITVNTSDNSLHVHDAVTVGGHKIPNRTANDTRYVASFRNNDFGSAIDNMLVGRIDGIDGSVTYSALTIGIKLSLYNSVWEQISYSTPMTLDNFRAFGAVSVCDFGAKGDDSDDTQAFTSAVATKLNVFVPHGKYNYSEELSLSYGQELTGEGQKGDDNGSIINYTGTGNGIIIDASLAGMQHCAVENIRLTSSTGDVGLHIFGSGVNQINDWHRVQKVSITGFKTQIQVTGRTIWSTFEHIELGGGEHSFVAVDGAVDELSFNANTFTNMRCTGASLQGMIVKAGQACTWTGCNFEGCNTSNTDGIGAVEIENSESFIFQNCYLERNGASCTNDRNDLNSCSYGIWFKGVYNYSPKIVGGYNVDTGIPVRVSGTQISGGGIDGGRLQSDSGIAIHIGVADFNLWDQAVAFTINGNIKIDNKETDSIVIVPTISQKRPAWIEQRGAAQWSSDASLDWIDLYRVKELTFSNSNVDRTINTLYNAYSGQTLQLFNYQGTGNVFIDSSLMDGGTLMIKPNETYKLAVRGYPRDGLLTIISGPTKTTATSAEISSVADVNNIYNKTTGKEVYLTDTNEVVYADGSNTTSTWKDALGVTKYTPA